MKLLCFGEIIWDTFADYRTIGGAPLNVAGHFSKLGGNATLVSALGRDTLGDAAEEALSKLNIDSSFVEKGDYETGYSTIFLKNGIPGYKFNFPCAWDNITLNEKQYDDLANKKWDAVYFGTLAQRSEKSKKTLEKILRENNFEYIFFDVNFRLNFYNKEILEKGLNYCNILKINDEELIELCKILNLEVCVNDIMKKYNIKQVILTEGKKGTSLFAENIRLHQDIGKVSVIDTVGAGDSLSAAYLYGIMKGWPLADILKKASHLADFVVSNKGAIPDYSEEIFTEFK